MGHTSTPIQSSQSRVFLIEGRARGDHKPSYENCHRMMGVSQGFGDIERIECPDPFKYGSFIEVGQIRGATERPTTSLEGKFMREVKSTLLELARKGCELDVHLHVGACQDASNFDVFDKILILEGATLTNYSTEDLGALQSADNAAVNETADISAKDMYEVLKIGYGSKAGSIITNEVVDVAICDSVSCGDCETESDGCQKIIAITKAAGGSPGTPPDVVYSNDKGISWYAHDIDTLTAAQDPNAIACVGIYAVVVSNSANSLSYVELQYLDGTTDPAWAEVTTGFVGNGEPNDIFSIDNVAFIVGDGGYIYFTEDPTAGVTVLDAGTITTSNLLKVHGLSADFVVAVGRDGVILYTENGTSFTLANSPVGLGTHIYALFVKSELEWWIGTSTGRVYYTVNGGTTWTEKSFSNSGTGVVWDIVFSTPSVGWIAHATSSPKGRILRTYNGGYTWVITPEKTGTIPAGDRFNALAVCAYDPNFVVGVGLADDAADGFIVVGED